MRYSMSRKESNQVGFIESYVDKKINASKCAEMAALSERQFLRKVNVFKNEGLEGCIHKLVGKRGNRRTNEDLEQKIANLVKEFYEEFGPSFIKRKLLENHQIKIALETLRQILIRNNLKFKTRRKNKKKYFKRNRKEHEGEMAQMDGSEHIWFGKEYNTIVAIIDDATSKVTAKFVPESNAGCAKVFKDYINKFGVPRTLYTDHGSCYKVNNGENKNGVTHFGRMLAELGVKQIFANTPQAKGRIERFFGTIQDWVVSECKLNDVKTIKEADKILQKLVERFNNENTVLPVNEVSLAVNATEFDQESIFCFKYKRKINNDMTVIYKKQIMLLSQKQPVNVKSGDSVEIRKSFEGLLSLYKDGQILKFNIIDQVKKLENKEEKMSLADEIEKEHRAYNPYKSGKKPKFFGRPRVKGDISTWLKR